MTYLDLDERSLDFSACLEFLLRDEDLSLDRLRFLACLLLLWCLLGDLLLDLDRPIITNNT